MAALAEFERDLGEAVESLVDCTRFSGH